MKKFITLVTVFLFFVGTMVAQCATSGAFNINHSSDKGASKRLTDAQVVIHIVSTFSCATAKAGYETLGYSSYFTTEAANGRVIWRRYSVLSPDQFYNSSLTGDYRIAKRLENDNQKLAVGTEYMEGTASNGEIHDVKIDNLCINALIPRSVTPPPPSCTVIAGTATATTNTVTLSGFANVTYAKIDGQGNLLPVVGNPWTTSHTLTAGVHTLYLYGCNDYTNASTVSFVVPNPPVPPVTKDTVYYTVTMRCICEGPAIFRYKGPEGIEISFDQAQEVDSTVKLQAGQKGYFIPAEEELIYSITSASKKDIVFIGLHNGLESTNNNALVKPTNLGGGNFEGSVRKIGGLPAEKCKSKCGKNDPVISYPCTPHGKGRFLANTNPTAPTANAVQVQLPSGQIAWATPTETGFEAIPGKRGGHIILYKSDGCERPTGGKVLRWGGIVGILVGTGYLIYQFAPGVISAFE